MKSDDKVVVKLLGIVAFIAIIGMSFGHIEKQDQIANEKMDRCITAVGQAIPDPNDTEERSAFLKECFEN